MDTQLYKYIELYLKTVEQLCMDMLEYFHVRCKSELINHIFGVHSNQRFQINDKIYTIHGIGCYVEEGEDRIINWNFGYRGRWCGIEPYFLSEYIENNCDHQSKYINGDYVKDILDQSVESGKMFERNGMYYFCQDLSNTIKPVFPDDFDKLKISKYENKWEINCNKVIKRFIRKAVWVAGDIDKDLDKYLLEFVKYDQVIYHIYYSDISYPESAVRIMSDEIIRNL